VGSGDFLRKKEKYDQGKTCEAVRAGNFNDVCLQ
jgi:hypothetical protein